MKEAAMMNKLTALWHPFGIRITKHADSYTLGVPDHSYTIEGNCGWIEAKEVKNKTDSKGKIHFQDGQPTWLYNEMKAGGNPFVMCNWECQLGFFLFMIPYEEIFERYELAIDIEGLTLSTLKEMSTIMIQSDRKKGMGANLWTKFAERCIEVMRNEIIA